MSAASNGGMSRHHSDGGGTANGIPSARPAGGRLSRPRKIGHSGLTELAEQANESGDAFSHPARIRPQPVTCEAITQNGRKCSRRGALRRVAWLNNQWRCFQHGG